MDLDTLTAQMLEALIAHIPGAHRDGDATATLPFGGLRIEVRVQRVFETGVVQQHVWLTGGALGARWIEDNFAGFSDNPTAAVVQGVHDWVEGNFEAIRNAFAGASAPRPCSVDGVAFDLYVSAVTARGARGSALAQSLDGKLVDATLDQLPVLHPTGPTFVGVFLGRTGDGPITSEVKVDGSDWPVDLSESIAWPDGEGYASVRQLGVLVPRQPRVGWAPAVTVRRTLERLGECEGGQGLFGSTRHRFALTPPLAAPPSDLPEDYRWFVSNISASGIGPGYGLLPPSSDAQSVLRQGQFTGTAPRGVLALADHGCNAIALLVCTGERRGEVWIDRHEEGFAKLADSFREYYESWLIGAVRRAPTERVKDPAYCALPNALSAYLKSWEEQNPGGDARSACSGLGAGSIATQSSGDDYFDPGDALDLCAGCLHVGRGMGVEPRHIAPGMPPKQGR